MQGQDVISRTDRRPVTHKGTSTLNPAKDLPLLKLIRDATFISRQQLELLIAGQTKETNYVSRNRRLAHLVELGQIKVYPPCYSYRGQVFGITERGMKILELAGLGLFRSRAYVKTQPNVVQMPRYLMLNRIEIAARESFVVLQFIRARELRSMNIVVRCPTRKVYDSLAVIAGVTDSNTQIYLGIQYERSLKSKVRYARMRQNIEADNQIHGLLYIVDTDADAVILSREVCSAKVPVGVVVAALFESRGADAALRFSSALSVVRAMAGIAARPMCDPLPEFEPTNDPVSGF